MDTLTHVMLGANLARAVQADRRALWAFVAAANLPDVDIVSAVAQPPLGFLARRTLTHSMLGGAALALVFAWALWAWRHDRPWRVWLGVALWGVGTHLAYDLVNAYGVALFHPFSTRRYELGCAFIVDVWMWGILAAGLVGARFLGRTAPRWALLALVLYTAVCWGARVRAGHMLADVLARQGAADAVYIFPEPFGPHRFRGVVRRGGGYELYLLHVVTGRVEPRGTVRSAWGIPEVERVRCSEAARRLERFYAAPVWRVRAGGPCGEGGVIVEVFDLRFRSLVLGGSWVPFAFRFRVGPEGVGDPQRIGARGVWDGSIL